MLKIEEVTVVLQVSNMDTRMLDRCCLLCADRFDADVLLVAPKGIQAECQLGPWGGATESRPEVVVYILPEGVEPVALPEAQRALGGVFKIVLEKDQNRLANKIRMRNIDGAFDYDKLDDHVFNRVSASHGKGYIYFPYGYLYRMSGHGPLDEFGFRVAEDLKALEARPNNHKLIVTFGGSTTWSIDCLPSETYTKRIEASLNVNSEVIEKGLHFTCVNFGQVSYTVLSEIMTFILFSWDVKPDIVIAHDGWNDLLYGAYTDPYLVQERNIVYPCDLEPWGQHLHDGAKAETTKNGPKPFPFRSAPSHVLNAYFTRKEQFRRIVESAGSAFVWGLQPCLYDKNSLSTVEQAFTDASNPVNKDDWSEIRKRTPELLRATAQACEGQITHFIDVGKSFNDLSDDIDHFTDTIHLTPEGDRAVAQVYSDYIVKNLVE